MPWKIVNAMDQKIQLIADWQSQNFSVTDLSQKYGISRPIVYKMIERYGRLGIEGLKEQSRAPKNCPHRTSKKILDLIIKEKLINRKRGPRKVRAQLKRKYPELELPAISTIGYLLKKEGLVKERKKRRHVPPYTQPFLECTEPNDVWSLDYKGQFYMKNKHVCYPLTASDNCSRFILGCNALAGPRYLPTKQCLEHIFREYGLPYAIRFDNGTPFASQCVGGLSQLMIWFILLGIIPERIRKGCPQENSRHERMHRSLKHDILDNPAKNLRQQQQVFDTFRHDFNNDRPHEGLDDRTPSDCYKKSDRPYIEQPHPPEYGHEYMIRHVNQNGCIKINQKVFFLTESLAGQPVGLKEIADGIWQLQFSFYILGSVDLRKNKIIKKV